MICYPCARLQASTGSARWLSSSTGQPSSQSSAQIATFAVRQRRPVLQLMSSLCRVAHLRQRGTMLFHCLSQSCKDPSTGLSWRRACLVHLSMGETRLPISNQDQHSIIGNGEKGPCSLLGTMLVMLARSSTMCSRRPVALTIKLSDVRQ